MTNAEKRHLKGLAQRMEPLVYLGKAGMTDAFLAGMEVALTNHELVKLKFAAFKDERHELGEQIAQRTGSELIWIVGHVAVFYRQHPDPAKRKIAFSGHEREE
jgi:RNA-binding protein